MEQPEKEVNDYLWQGALMGPQPRVYGTYDRRYGWMACYVTLRLTRKGFDNGDF